jgi:hypothetical protein
LKFKRGDLVIITKVADNREFKEFIGKLARYKSHNDFDTTYYPHYVHPVCGDYDGLWVKEVVEAKGLLLELV